jgi:hypothetical protein
MSKPIRRVVTGHNSRGKSVFVADGPSPHVFRRGTGSVAVTELWETRGCPADNRGHADAIDHPFRLPPPKNGSVFRIIEYPPDSVRLKTLDPDSFFPEMGARAAGKEKRRHPGMHRTHTVDYAIGCRARSMRHGRRRGSPEIRRCADPARHQSRWSNRTDEPAYLAFVLIDAEPVAVGASRPATPIHSPNGDAQLYKK